MTERSHSALQDFGILRLPYSIKPGKQIKSQLEAFQFLYEISSSVLFSDIFCFYY